MANAVCKILVTEKRLEPAVEETDGNSGAVVEFFGIVRRDENGREIEGIEYEAHLAMAEHQLRQIAEDAAARFSLRSVTIHHRIGFVGVGEASLFLQVRASHRGAAFEASQWIVDELKKKVPIWKKPKFKKNFAAGVVDAGPQAEGCSHAPVARGQQRNTESAAQRAAATE
jgi:molybdopterin synthase catalytic subunit